MGSDPAREMLSVMDPDCEVPIALFETKEEFEKVLAWVNEQTKGDFDMEDLFK